LRKLILVFLLFCTGFLRAQSRPPVPQLGNDQPTLAFQQMELFSRYAHSLKDETAQHAAAKRDEEIARAQFWQKANRFVSLWAAFANRLNDKQTFDVKMARKLSKAFHELETSQGWPAGTSGQLK
jgi:hypothetical protein